MVTTENSLGLRALRLPHIRRPKSWQFSSPPARLRHQASLQPPRQRALRLICYIEINKCIEMARGSAQRTENSLGLRALRLPHM